LPRSAWREAKFGAQVILRADLGRRPADELELVAPLLDARAEVVGAFSCSRALVSRKRRRLRRLAGRRERLRLDLDRRASAYCASELFSKTGGWPSRATAAARASFAQREAAGQSPSSAAPRASHARTQERLGVVAFSAR
jgi:hypothetical protein